MESRCDHVHFVMWFSSFLFREQPATLQNDPAVPVHVHEAVLGPSERRSQRFNKINACSRSEEKSDLQTDPRGPLDDGRRAPEEARARGFPEEHAGLQREAQVQGRRHGFSCYFGHAARGGRDEGGEQIEGARVQGRRRGSRPRRGRAGAGRGRGVRIRINTL